MKTLILNIGHDFTDIPLKTKFVAGEKYALEDADADRLLGLENDQGARYFSDAKDAEKAHAGESAGAYAHEAAKTHETGEDPEHLSAQDSDDAPLGGKKLKRTVKV